MNYSEWIDDIICQGLLCDEYATKVQQAKSKKQVVDIALDANGVSYLQEMMEKGHALPYDVIRNDFRPYLNGRYVSVHKNGENGREYTGSVYFEQINDLLVHTTITSLLNCECNVIVPKNSIALLYSDGNCTIHVICMENAKCKVYHSGDLRVTSEGSNVKIIKKG
jgi:hypothetical protein